jgi:3-oxoacyl-[acyl-carrier-protein] synthase II
VPGLADAADLLGPPRTEGGFDPETGLKGRDLRHKDRASRLAIRASEPALRAARLWDGDATTIDRDRIAVVVSSNLGILDSVCQFADVIAEQTVMGLSSLGLPQTSSNVTAGAVAIRYGLRGPNLTVTNGSTSGLDAIYWARNLIAARRADAALVVGVEPTDDVVLKLLQEQSVDGAAAVVLESATGAAARGARPLARIGGYTRSAELRGAVTGALAGTDRSLGLWLTDERDGVESTPGLLAGRAQPATRDLQARLGRCSGALGVLQVAAATAHLAGDGAGDVLATAGGATGDDAAAALLVTATG